VCDACDRVRNGLLTFDVGVQRATALPPRRPDAAASQDSPSANAAGCRALAPTVSEAVTTTAHMRNVPAIHQCSPARGSSSCSFGPRI